MKEVKLPSGAILGLGDTPFIESKNLFQSVVKSMRSIEVDPKIKTVEEFMGAILGAQLSDADIEKALWVCMERCTYGDARAKIIPSIFEPLEARADFMDICLEVGQENLRPFMKGLYAALPRLIEMIGNPPQP